MVHGGRGVHGASTNFLFPEPRRSRSVDCGSSKFEYVAI